ncbi:MAG: 3-oxoacyl-ACP reductase [Moraxella sp.]|nr:3-oxoacyl-ACP reductase [Moraxella sp.]
MSDRYGELVQSSLGKKVAKNLGLPMPIKLDRFETGQPILCGEVVLSGTGDVLPLVHEHLVALDAKITTDDTLDERLSDDNARFKVAIFDATALKTADDLTKLYDFFHTIARRIKSSGRVIIIARPECCTGADIGFATAQRAVLGFTKSLAKEFKKGISANVIYTQIGAENHLPHALDFFMSAKSAYVSGQAVTLTKAATMPDGDDKQPLAGKTILVTGASRGIGEATARTLARDGAKVVCLDVPNAKDDLQKVADDIGGQVLTLDITALDAGEQIVRACGVLDGVVHNAGITRDKTLANMSDTQWQSVLDINLKSIISINDHLLSHGGLSTNARVVCVSSISAIAGNMGQTNYATSKAGVIGLVKATAKNLQDGMTINAVAPGFIETKMTSAIPFAIREAGRRMNAMSQGGEPVDVAETIAWLSSPKAGGLNGQIVRVCGLSLLGA